MQIAHETRQISGKGFRIRVVRVFRGLQVYLSRSNLNGVFDQHWAPCRSNNIGTQAAGRSNRPAASFLLGSRRFRTILDDPTTFLEGLWSIHRLTQTTITMADAMRSSRLNSISIVFLRCQSHFHRCTAVADIAPVTRWAIQRAFYLFRIDRNYQGIMPEAIPGWAAQTQRAGGSPSIVSLFPRAKSRPLAAAFPVARLNPLQPPIDWWLPSI